MNSKITKAHHAYEIAEKALQRAIEEELHIGLLVSVTLGGNLVEGKVVEIDGFRVKIENIKTGKLRTFNAITGNEWSMMK